MAKTTCILHVGTEKTGSTSLQRFFSLNRQSLAERHIWLPRALVHNPESSPCNHMFLSTASHLSIAKPDDLQSALGFSSMADVQRHRIDVRGALSAEFAALPDPPSTIIISNEHVHSRLRDSVDLFNAKSMLEPFCSEFRVVVYLRSQHTMAQSVAITAIRNGATELRQIPTFESRNGFDPVLGVDFGYFDHAALLARLEAVFGAASLDVRLYDPNEMYEGDIISDFFSRLGEDIAGLPRPGRENTNLAPQAVMFLTKLNKYLALHPNPKAFRERILALLERAYPGRPHPLPQSKAVEFLKLFDASNEAVCSRWFPGRTTLFREQNEGIATEAVDYSEADVFEVFIELFAAAGGRNLV